MKQEVLSLFEYGDWASQRLLEAASRLTAQQFTQKVLSSFGSVHLTLTHILGAEILWFERWQGRSPAAILAAEEVPSPDAVRSRWAPLVEARRAYLADVQEAGLNERVQWTNMRGQPFTLLRWQLMLHTANHSTHHRSELATILTELGHEPDSTDLLEYYLGAAGQQWKPTALPK